MIPNVILHNSVSLDGSITGFQPDLETHYKLAAGLGAGAVLVGSATARSGLDLFAHQLNEEQEEGSRRPELDPDDPRPLLVLLDSGGLLQGMLLPFRCYQHFKDVVILVSEQTPPDYLGYLERRDYRHHAVGPGPKVDLPAALELLNARYGVESISTDAGPTLCSVLLAQGLAQEVSHLVHPLVVGAGGQNIHGRLPEPVALELRSRKERGRGLEHVRYQVSK